MLYKRTKNIFTLMIAALFVLSVGYFAVLPPTSAYFYDYREYQKIFTFGTLSLDPVFIDDDTIDLTAATKLEDPDEILFDEAIQIVEIEAENDGSLPARVYLTVSALTGNLDGLRYFFYYEDDEALGDTVKETIASKGIITFGTSPEAIAATKAALIQYNIGDGSPGGDEGRYIVIQPGVTNKKILKIAFWADYNEVGEVLKQASSGVAVYNHYDVKITLHAVQNTNGAFTRN